MDVTAPERTIDLVRHEFKESKLNATDIGKRAGLKPDQGRRILNRGGGTSEETAKLLLSTIREMTGRAPSEGLPETEARPEQSPEDQAPPQQQQQSLRTPDRDHAHPVHARQAPLIEEPDEDGMTEIRRPPSKPIAAENTLRLKRGITLAPFPEMELGAKVRPEDHEISPFDVFERVENESVILESARLRAEKRAEEERRRAEEMSAAEQVEEIAKAVLEEAEPEKVPEEGSASETSEIEAETAQEVTLSDIMDPVTVAQNEAREDQADLQGVETPEEVDLVDPEVREVSLKILTSKPKDGRCRVVLEGDIPEDRVNEIIAMFLRETVSS